MWYEHYYDYLIIWSLKPIYNEHKGMTQLFHVFSLYISVNMYLLLWMFYLFVYSLKIYLFS